MAKVTVPLFHIITLVVCLLGGRISVSDGTLTVVAKNQSIMEKVLEKVFIYFSTFMCFSRGTKQYNVFSAVSSYGLWFCLLDQLRN